MNIFKAISALSKDRLLSLGSQVYLNLSIYISICIYIWKGSSPKQKMDVNIIHIIRSKIIERIVLHHTGMSHSLRLCLLQDKRKQMVATWPCFQ